MYGYVSSPNGKTPSTATKWIPGRSMSNFQLILMTSRVYYVYIYIYIESQTAMFHDDAIKWKQFPRYWPFMPGIHWSSVNSPQKSKWCGALMFSLICVWINRWVSNRAAGDLRRHRAYYDGIVMQITRIDVGPAWGLQGESGPHIGLMGHELRPDKEKHGIKRKHTCT